MKTKSNKFGFPHKILCAFIGSYFGRLCQGAECAV